MAWLPSGRGIKIRISSVVANGLRGDNISQKSHLASYVGGLTHASHDAGGFSTITRKRKPTTTELHNARMAKRRRDNAYYNARYKTNTYISHPTWGLRHAYMTQHPMWLRDQLITGNSICW